MKTVTVRDLRNNFSKVEVWLGEGQEIQIEKRGKPIGFLSATPRAGSALLQQPDWAARRKAIWGEKVFSSAEVREMREAELAGEEG